MTYDLEKLGMHSASKLNLLSTKKGVYIIKELVCKDLPDDIDAYQKEEDFRVNSERKILQEKRSSQLTSPNKYLKKDLSTRAAQEKMFIYDTRELKKHGAG